MFISPALFVVVSHLVQCWLVCLGELFGGARVSAIGDTAGCNPGAARTGTADGAAVIDGPAGLRPSKR